MCANCVAHADAAAAADGGIAGLGAGRLQLKEIADKSWLRIAAIIALVALTLGPFVLAAALGT